MEPSFAAWLSRLRLLYQAYLSGGAEWPVFQEAPNDWLALS